MAEHHRLLREAFERHGGVEANTQGDGFFVVFSSATDAVAAAAEAQRSLSAGPVRVRMGLHTGEPALTDEGYVGLDVHRAARIGGAGHGGQIVVSETTRALLDGEFDLRDLGEHRLKDLGVPIRLFQLGRDEFPPLRSLSQARLPVEPVPLLGRKRELGDLLRLLGGERARLVTLTGPGGIGKTSLAIAAAGELVESFEGGAALVELASVREPTLVLPSIGEQLGAEEDAATHIGDRELLIALDNLEQVVAAAGEIAQLLGACPNLSILATSREPLRIAGEREFPLRTLAEAPAVELFRQRAEAVLPGFTADYHQLAEICRRLDSLPLAIELAAARVKVLPPGELLERLERRLPLLTSSRRDLPERQQTLRATIEWSYDLCSADEQQLFCRLGVFSGGFTLDSAETVCGADLDTLASLLDKSLVRREGDRFSMLETIREFAVERLEESGEADELRRRHAEYLAELAEASQTAAFGSEQMPVREQFRVEWDNVRAALTWALESGETELGLRIAGSLTMSWLDRNQAVEGERWLRALLAGPGQVDDTVRANALMTASNIAGVRSDFDQAAAWGIEALEHFRVGGSELGLAWSLTTMATIPLERGDVEQAGLMLEEAEALHRKIGDPRGFRRVLHLQGQQAAAVGDVEQSRRLLREAAELSRADGDLFSAAVRRFIRSAMSSSSRASSKRPSAAYRRRAAPRLGLQLRSARLLLPGRAGRRRRRAGDPERAALLWGFAEAYEERLRFTLRLTVAIRRTAGSGRCGSTRAARARTPPGRGRGGRNRSRF